MATNSNASKLASQASYVCPDRFSSTHDRLAWIKQSAAESQAFLQTQRGYSDIESAIALIGKSRETELPERMSKIYVNWIKRQIREWVATLSSIRTTASFKTDNAEWFDQAEIQNKLFTAWWYNTFADRDIRKMIQYAGVTGTGYLYIFWNPNLLGAGRGDIEIKALGPVDVLPVQLPLDNDIQNAYAVIIREEMPINAAKKRYWQFQDLIVPTRSAPSGMRAALGRAGEILQGALQIIGMDGIGESKQVKDYTSPTVDIYSVYIDDPSINTGNQDVVMGEGNYAYTVPYMGKEIPTGMFQNGKEIIHRVTPEEARLYPNRRLLVCTETALLYDNASPWWHGMVPVIQFKADDWPWDYLGYSGVRDTRSIQDTMNAHIRGVADAANCKLDPPLMCDEEAVADSDWESFSGREPGSKIRVNMRLFGNQQPVRSIFTPDQYDVPQWIPEYIQQMQEWISSLIGSKDLTAMAKAQQIPSADTMEKYLEMAGALVQDVSRNLELVIRDLGRMWGPLCFQFYPLKRRITMLGKDGITEEDFTFDYGSMIPEPPQGIDPHEMGRRHCFNFFFHVTPNSLTRMTQTTQKLLYLQLWRDGRFPIDPWTVGEALDIPNMGPIPGGATNLVGRWQAWQKLMTETGLDIQQMQQQAVQGNMIVNAIMQALRQGGGGGQGSNTPPAPPAGGPEGRPPTAQVAPHFAVKNDSQTGPRQVVAETP